MSIAKFHHRRVDVEMKTKEAKESKKKQYSSCRTNFTAQIEFRFRIDEASFELVNVVLFQLIGNRV